MVLPKPNVYAAISLYVLTICQFYRGGQFMDDGSIYVEIGRGGILRVFIVGEQDDVDSQSDAHRLLAEITGHLIC